jgi:hypothetical protein
MSIPSSAVFFDAFGTWAVSPRTAWQPFVRRVSTHEIRGPCDEPGAAMAKKRLLSESLKRFRKQLRSMPNGVNIAEGNVMKTETLDGF